MELLTVKETAKKLKTNPHMVYALIKAKKITALKLGRYKIADYEIERFIRENQGMDLTKPDDVTPIVLNSSADVTRYEQDDLVFEL
jgi:excisionase family DNA binding protein